MSRKLIEMNLQVVAWINEEDLKTYLDPEQEGMVLEAILSSGDQNLTVRELSSDDPRGKEAEDYTHEEGNAS